MVNPAERNALGIPPGYLFVPGDNSVPYMRPGSPMRARAGFVDHHFWVTRHDREQLYAGGAYPSQSRGGEGLPKWVSDNQRVDSTDVVAWYTTGVTHVPRPEDWPVMPVAHVGFQLLPVGFFARNPAMDVR